MILFKKIRVLLVAVFFPCLALFAGEKNDFSDVRKKDFSASEMRAIFTDGYCYKLKKGVTAAQIKQMKNPVLRDMAERMLARKYQDSVHRRTRKYAPYYPVEKLAKELKTSTYSRFENPTGIYFEEGELAVLFVGKAAKGQDISLKIHCWDKDGYGKNKTYPLEAGINVFKVEQNGLAYFNYYTEDLDAPAISVNIATGTANGVFSGERSSNEDWAEMISSAKGDCIDIVGKYVQLLLCAETMKKTCPEDGLALIRDYDEIIRLQQDDIMGLTQFNRRKPNHMHGRTMWTGFMHADGIGAAFNDNTMDSVGNPDNIRKQSWGISHEFGHVNQTRPNLKWVCTSEVTNNIFSCWANWKLNPGDMRLEHEHCSDWVGGIIGGRFNSYLNSALVHKERWLCQRGQDKPENYQDGGDHFVKVAPLWQLQLYMNVAGRGPADFYPQLFELARKADVPKTSDGKDDNGAMQLEFMKNACAVSNQNLMPFFEAIGMLKPIDQEMDDYSRGWLKITEADCQKLKKFGEKFPPAASPVIYYISANNVEVFQKGAPVKGPRGKGVEENGETLKFSHEKWKNVVAFETYAGDKLTQISMSGLGCKDNSSTIVRYPAGSTRVEAVGWDGKRVLAYGKPGKKH